MKVIVIGSGMVGIRFCENIRKFDKNNQIDLIVFAEEKEVPYNRVQLSNYLKTFNKEQLYLKNENWYEKNNINIIYKKIYKILPLEKAVITEDNQKYHYDKLILATGSYPFVPPVDGISNVDIAFSCFKENYHQPIFVYRTIKDLERITKFA